MTLINGSRREFLKTIAAAGAGLLPGGGLLAQSARQAGRNNSGRIDVHHFPDTSLLFNGTLSQCPDIRFIVNHSGAAVPVLAGRIKDRVPGASTTLFSSEPSNHDGKNEKIPNGVFYELRKLYYECAHAAYPMPIAAVMKLVPTSQLLFGTDYPAEPMESTLDNLPGNGLSREVLQALDRGNAERLFPRLRGVS